jgi:hypothetical protein
MAVMEEQKQKICQNHNDIPIIIAPTENGWLPAKFNRRINPGPSTFIITAKNNRLSIIICLIYCLLIG